MISVMYLDAKGYKSILPRGLARAFRRLRCGFFFGASKRPPAMLSNDQLLKKLDQLRALPENEWIEFKAATNDFDSHELGKYFSALSNEANLKGQPEAWLVFGVQDKPIPRPIVGSIYPKGKTIETVKNEIAQNTNDFHSFIEIHVVHHPHGRVVMFQIPPALEGTPTSWKGKPYGRNGESISKKRELAEYTKEHFLRQAARRDLKRELLPLEHESDCLDEFVGRQAMIERVRRFINDRDRGVLLIKGPPGKGKSALLAHLANTFKDVGPPAPISFCYRRDRNPDQCVRHLFASLLINHDLATPANAQLPVRTEDRYEEFQKTLRDASGRLFGDSKQVLLIDALDEASEDGGARAFDRLPRDLPPRVYIVATTRDVPELDDLPPNVRADVIDMEDPELKSDDRRDGCDYARSRLANLSPSGGLLDAIGRVGDGNFLVLRLLCGRVRELGCESGGLQELLRELASEKAAERLGFFYSS